MTTLDYLVLAGLVAVVVHIWAWRRVHPYDADGIYFVTIGVMVVVSLCVGLVQFYEWSGEGTCQAQAEGLGRNYSYDVWSDCLVEADNGDLVPLDNLRFNEDGEVQS